MKACIIQPPYSRDLALSDEYFEYKLNLLDQCDSSIDIIVLPEYSDVPCATTGREDSLEYHKKYIDILLNKCIETAKRCNSLLFVNALSLEETGYRNTTYCYNRKGELVGKYFKKHLPPLEVGPLALDAEYTYEFSEPYVLEIEGLRFGFLTCYDFYFYEAFGNIARQNLDLIIGNSLQRSDSHDAIEIMCRFLAYNTNTHVIRSSVSFDENSDICGASMVVTPKGKVLCNMKGRFGMETAEFDPADKYYKPAGYGNPDAPHYSYIEYGRKPWQYRPGGSFIARHDAIMPYPRICAHRGFSSVAPENSLPAFGAAVALGAQEIEFDLWLSKDEEWVSIHDYKLDRVSDGSGNVWDYTLDELKRFDFGKKYASEFEGLRILTFEEILKKLSCHTVMNIHIKTLDDDCEYIPLHLKKIIDLIDKYDCRKYCYIMCTNDNVLRMAQEMAPDIARCVGFSKEASNMIPRALKYGCKKIQLMKPQFDQAMIDEAHSHGIICNVFWSDNPVQTRSFLKMGIDVILTNDYNLISQVVADFKAGK